MGKVKGCGEEIIWDDMLFGEGQSCKCGDSIMGDIILCDECENKQEDSQTN